jgi:hypothetical protein
MPSVCDSIYTTDRLNDIGIETIKKMVIENSTKE